MHIIQVLPLNGNNGKKKHNWIYYEIFAVSIALRILLEKKSKYIYKNKKYIGIYKKISISNNN